MVHAIDYSFRSITRQWKNTHLSSPHSSFLFHVSAYKINQLYFIFFLNKGVVYKVAKHVLVKFFQNPLHNFHLVHY